MAYAASVVPADPGAIDRHRVSRQSEPDTSDGGRAARTSAVEDETGLVILAVEKPLEGCSLHAVEDGFVTQTARFSLSSCEVFHGLVSWLKFDRIRSPSRPSRNHLLKARERVCDAPLAPAGDRH